MRSATDPGDPHSGLCHRFVGCSKCLFATRRACPRWSTLRRSSNFSPAEQVVLRGHTDRRVLQCRTANMAWSPWTHGMVRSICALNVRAESGRGMLINALIYLLLIWIVFFRLRLLAF